MPNQRIDQLNAETTPAAADVLPVYSIAGSDTKKITVKNLVQQGAALVDNASIPAAKVNLSGISGTNLSAGTVAASKFDTSTIPATGGVTVASSNLQLVAPTSPIVRNAGTGSLEHAVSGATAGTYTKVTVDNKGHVTVGAALTAGDLPIAAAGTVGVMSPGTGLSVTGGGVLNHTSSVTAGTTSGFTYNAQGHITGAVALAGADLPIATSSVRGAVRPGAGLSVDGNGILDVTAATNAVLGGVIAGADFSVTTGTISLAAQAGIAAGTYTKLTVNSKGIATAGTVLSAGDIPNIATSQITSGTLSIDRYGANTITGAKLANYATGKISEAFPTADYISQLYFNPLDRTLYMWDGNVFQPIGVSYGQVVFSGTYDAGTNLITSVTTEGAAIGLTVGGALTAPVTANKSHYVVVDQPGTGTAPAPAIALSPPDMLLSNGTTWVLLDVSDTVTAQLASNIQVSPAGNIASTNVQSALQELDDEKLPLAGGTLTGNLALNTGIAIVYEGATTDNFETTLYVVDPTADRTILLPNVSGTVVTTGDTGTVTSTMLLDNTIVNADINASAAIVDTKLATIATAGKVSNSATTATDANTASAIVARDASGNFTAGTITAALTGAASSNVLKAGDTMTGVLAVTAGTAALPAITPSGDPNTGIYSPGADQLAISTNGTGRLFIDASGNIGVGTGSPANFAGFVTLALADSSGGEIDFIKGSTVQGSLYNADDIFYVESKSTVPTAFVTNGTERLRITSAGLVGIGTSSPGEKLTVAGNISLSAAQPYIALIDSIWGVASTFRVGVNTLGTSTGDYQLFNVPTGKGFAFAQNNATNSLVIDPTGKVGIGTTSPGSPLTIESSAGSQVKITYPSIASYFLDATSGGDFAINKDGTERARIDSSGRLLVGTSSAFDTSYIGTNYQIGIEKLNTYAGFAMKANFNNADGCYILLAKSRGSSLNTKTVVNDGDNIGAIVFEGADGTNMRRAAQITCLIDGTPGADDMPGRLVFSTTADGASSPTERMRIQSTGTVLINKTSSSFTTSGFEYRSGNELLLTSTTTNISINRLSTDGDLIEFFQDTAKEGTISVSGSTVSYNGAHLSRWSQLPSGAERTEILRGSVLSNIDEMCEWGDEENEQLNRMKVSEIEGDKNVAGVFQAWDDDDDTYTNDFYCAMTGDFIIRIAQGVTVQRGDLLMSAGDGTAKPQDDDIIRSKTIAKVTSTNVSCTYDDGSYCVPCVLMAC